MSVTRFQPCPAALRPRCFMLKRGLLNYELIWLDYLKPILVVTGSDRDLLFNPVQLAIHSCHITHKCIYIEIFSLCQQYGID